MEDKPMLYSEVPLVQKGCCWMSFRCTLLFWGYLRVLFTLYLGFVDVLLSWPYHQMQEHLTSSIMVLFLMIKLNCFIGNLVMITAVHKKSLHLLRVSYRWEFLSAAAVYISLLVCHLLSLQGFFEEDMIMILKLVYFGMQLYIIVVARSEIFRMESKQVLNVSVEDTESKGEE